MVIGLFKIYFIDCTSKEIRKDYFYSDWGKVKNQLQTIRDQILQRFDIGIP